MPIIAGYLLVVAFMFGLGGWAGHTITANSYKADMLGAERAATKAYQDQAIKLNEVSAALEKEKNEQKTIYRTIQKRIPEVIGGDVARYSADCVTSDGLQLINEALTGKESDTSKPVKSVPELDSPIG